MTNLRRLFSASLTAAVIVLGLALTASPARADIITFVVDEGAVPGANDQNVTPDPNDITGKYQELLILDTGTGKFQAFLVVNFTGYVLDGVPVPSQIGAPVAGGETDNTNLYGLYALVTASGDFSSTPIGGGNTLLQFVLPHWNEDHL